MSDQAIDYFAGAVHRALDRARVTSAIAFAERFVRLPGSARSDAFDSSITPWTRAPIEDLVNPFFRMGTMVGPIQSGKSVIGEVALCKWVSTETSGDVQCNWEDDEKADARWDKRIERILQACEPVMQRWPAARGKVQKGLVLFPHLNLINQGVFTEKRVSSDSIRFQINEEIHSWKPGRLAQAWGRTTAYWNSVVLNISNAGVKGDQLHQAFEAGTQEHWEVKCPGCGLYHRMRTRFEDKKSDLGGLRYDADGCRRKDGSYDYLKLEGTIRYQMPCGYLVHEDAKERRELSLSGQYGTPENAGAHRSHRSRTLEAVSVDYIPFLRLIQEKHAALKAMKYGDPEPWKRYLQERECRFWDPQDRPSLGKIVVNSSLKKDRVGLRAHSLFFDRLFALDRQQGSAAKNEFPHWWLVIRDVLTTGDSQLVWEGKCLTDENAIEVIDRHECRRIAGVADSGDDTTHVYQFCLRYGINAIKGEGEQFFAHAVEEQDPISGKARIVMVKRIWSPERPLYLMVRGERTRENPLEEPEFFLYSKSGIRERLAWLRSGGSVKWEVPGDVSDDYKAHMEAEELVEERDKRGVLRMVWSQVKDRNDLFVDECYIALQMERAGLIGAQVLNFKSGDGTGGNAVDGEKGSE